MNLVDKNLIEALIELTPAERHAIEEALRSGRDSRSGAVLSETLRRVRRALKRRVRNRLPAKLKWLA